MKRLLLFLLLACPAFGVITPNVHQGSNTVTSGTNTVTVTIGTGETVLVLVDLHGPATRTVTSVVDSSGANTYTQKTSAANATTSQTFIWASLGVTNAATSVTVTMSSTYTVLNVMVVTYGSVNAFGTTATNTGTSTALSVDLVTQDANNYVVALLGQTAGSTTVTFTANVGTIRIQQIGSDNLRLGAGLDNTAASATTVSNSVTSNKSAAWSACALELRSGAGSPTFVPQVRGIIVQ